MIPQRIILQEAPIHCTSSRDFFFFLVCEYVCVIYIHIEGGVHMWVWMGVCDHIG